MGGERACAEDGGGEAYTILQAREGSCVVVLRISGLLGKVSASPC
jgi:hypothetical protein